MLALRSAVTRQVMAKALPRASSKAAAPAKRLVVRTASKKIVPEYSPHLTIYKFPFPAIASITVRITGVGLAAGFAAAGAASLVCPTAVPALFALIKCSPTLLAMTKAAVAFPLSYHYLAGIRHIVWDNTNWGIDSVEAVTLSSQVLVGASAVVTVGAMLL